MMWLTIPFQDGISFGRGLVIGYTTMVVAFLLIYFGYRDNVAGGTVSFGRAFVVGASIAVVASLCYVASCEVLYFNVLPDYMEKYQAHALEAARKDGATEAAIAQKKAEMDKFATGVRCASAALHASVAYGMNAPNRDILRREPAKSTA